MAPIYFLYRMLSGMTVEALAAAVAGSQFLLPGDDGAPPSRALSVPGAPPPLITRCGETEGGIYGFQI
jgi:hypothetical protein